MMLKPRLPGLRLAMCLAVMYLFAGSEEEEDVEMVEDDEKEDQGEKKVPTNRIHGSINYTWTHMGSHVTKPVFGVSGKASFKPVSSAAETS